MTSRFSSAQLSQEIDRVYAAVTPGHYTVTCNADQNHTYQQHVRRDDRQYRICGACGAIADFSFLKPSETEDPE